jgi:hypothetical protein
MFETLAPKLEFCEYGLVNNDMEFRDILSIEMKWWQIKEHKKGLEAEGSTALPADKMLAAASAAGVAGNMMAGVVAVPAPPPPPLPPGAPPPSSQASQAAAAGIAAAAAAAAAAALQRKADRYDSVDLQDAGIVRSKNSLSSKETPWKVVPTKQRVQFTCEFAGNFFFLSLLFYLCIP